MATDTAVRPERNLKLRVLPQEEWDKLKGLHTHDRWIPDPKVSTVLVVEDNEGIAGLAVVQLCVHMEPLWVKDPHRDPSMGFHLWNHARKLLQEHGVENYYTSAESEMAAEYLENLGLMRLKATSFLGSTNGRKE